jgi:HD-GYP domain-containing protein (c-di-GMP phosphodiesterase class II)
MRIREQTKNINDNYRILLLDDDATYVAKKIEVLKSYGYSIEGETVVKRALSKLQDNKYDLLILDYLMDEMRGDKVVEAIRMFDKDLYILLLTGYAEAPVLEIMDTLDITGYCEKSNDNSQLLVLIKSALKSINMMKKVRKTRDGLSKILQAVPNIYKIQPIELIIKDALLNLVSMMNVSDAFILVDNDSVLYSGLGVYENGIDTIDGDLFGFIEQVRSSKDTYLFVNSILLPITSENYGTLGVLYLKSEDKVMDEDDVQQLTIYTTIVASAITNGLLQNTINTQNEVLQQTKEEMSMWYLSTVQTIRYAIDAKDHYTGGHSDRVSEYATKIGKALNLSQEAVALLRDSGTFHDVGKIGIDDSILKKAGRLTREEYEEIKKHPQCGAVILSAVSMFRDIIPVVLYHHERYDGSGYPKGLAGTQIPLLARILSVADALDAMTTNRSYSPAKSLEESIEELRKNAGTQFDPQIVDVTIKLIQDKAIITLD